MRHLTQFRTRTGAVSLRLFLTTLDSRRMSSTAGQKRGHAAGNAETSGSRPSKKQKHHASSENDITAPQASSFEVSAFESMEKDTMGRTWYEALQQEFAKPYFVQLKAFLLSQYKAQTIFPPMNNIYSWSRLTPLEAVKVVVLGQDPYHDFGQAHGLSFSVLPPTKPPGSLKNIYKEIAADYPSFKPPKDTGDLTPLAKAGVLWLNAVLTVQAHKANSHRNKGWETFTFSALRAVLQRKEVPGVVFMAWGLPAQRILKTLGVDKKKHLVLKSAHPSPLSAHKGFFGNGHFRLANVWLEKNHGVGHGIDWTAIGV